MKLKDLKRKLCWLDSELDLTAAVNGKIYDVDIIACYSEEENGYKRQILCFVTKPDAM